MYGMDVNPLTHRFHLEDLERQAKTLSRPKNRTAQAESPARRFFGTAVLRLIPFVFPASRKASEQAESKAGFEMIGAEACTSKATQAEPRLRSRWEKAAAPVT